MDQSNRNQGSTKMAIKIGAAGGIGAVVLLGGALATAALASAFVVGRNCRSSGKHRPRPKIPPPDKTENPSNGAIKEVVVSENDTDFMVSNHTSTLDENPRVEGKNLCDIEASEESLDFIGPKKLETDVISDGFVMITEEKSPLLDERLRFEPQNEDVDNEIQKEGPAPEQVSIEGGRAESDESDGEIKETCQQEAVEVIAEKQAVQEDNDDVLLCYDHEEIKVILVDNSVMEEVSIDDPESEKNVNVMEEGELDEENGSDNGELIFSKTDIEDEKKTTVPILDSFVAHGKMSGDKKEGRPTATETVELVKECEFIEEQLVEDEKKDILPALGSLVLGHENTNGEEKDGQPFPTDTVEIVKEHEFNEEQMVENEKRTVVDVLDNSGMEHQDMNGDEEIIVKDSELIEGGEEDNEIIIIKKYEDPIEVTSDKVHFDINGSIAYPMPEEVISVSPESIQVTKNHKNGNEQENEKEVEEELISLKNVEVTKGDNAMNEEVVDESTETVESSPKTVTLAKDDFLVMEEVKDGAKGENVTKDSVDKTVLFDQVQLSYQEVAGKIQEDKVVKKDDENVKCSGKSFVGKYAPELSVLLADSSCNRRMVIVTVSALSSISCSWFFGLSFVRLCFVMFLTMLLSSMVTE